MTADLFRVSLADRGLNVLRNEMSLLSFSIKFLGELQKNPDLGAVCPCDVRIEISDEPDQPACHVSAVRILHSRLASSGSMYAPPDWCAPEQRWRFHLGYLLRFILTSRQDFTERVTKPHWKTGKGAYRPCVNHWYQRLHALFNGHDAFGDDWLPVSEWVEQFLTALLRWPGQHRNRAFLFVEVGIEQCVAELVNRSSYIEPESVNC
jgi:hypothetical protein